VEVEDRAVAGDNVLQVLHSLWKTSYPGYFVSKVRCSVGRFKCPYVLLFLLYAGLPPSSCWLESQGNLTGKLELKVLSFVWSAKGRSANCSLQCRLTTSDALVGSQIHPICRSTRPVNVDKHFKDGYREHALNPVCRAGVSRLGSTRCTTSSNGVTPRKPLICCHPRA
jgi:hypothetical protein